MRPLSNMENKTLSDTNWKVELGNMIFQAQGSFETPLECNEYLATLTNQGSIWPFQSFWGLQKYGVVLN